MTTLFRSTDFDPTFDPDVLREGARRQFRLSWVLLLALAFAALGQVRLFDEAPAAAKLGHSRVVTPTFVPLPTFMPPPAAHTRPPSALPVRFA
jgi:hypothetical protein